MSAKPFYNDSLDDLLGKGTSQSRELPQDESYARIRETVPVFTEKCPKCFGSGRWKNTSKPCFTCQGKGKKTFKTSPEVRASADRSRQKKYEDNWRSFAERNPNEAAWIAQEAPKFDFAAKMMIAVKNYGDLTEGQMNACRNGVKRQAAYIERRTAEKSALADKVTDVGTEGLNALLTAFQTAKNKGANFPILRGAGIYMYMPAKYTDRVYVKTQGAKEYIGQVRDGKFFPSAIANDTIIKNVHEFMIDPKTAAVKYGRDFGSCCCCGKTLSDPASIEAGIGPICATKFGF